MTEFEQLGIAAYKAERLVSRRLARHTGMSEAQALKSTLETSAGMQGLACLLAAREQARQADAARLATRTQHKAQHKTHTKAALLASKEGMNEAGPAQWRAWFDGSAHPNPGKIGIGGLISAPDGTRVEICRGAGHGNSSEAEYQALIAVLEAALVLNPLQLTVYGDSQVVIDDVNRRTQAGAASLHPHRARARALMAQLAEVELRWIPRHRNGAADCLSQQAIAAWRHADADVEPGLLQPDVPAMEAEPGAQSGIV